MTVDHLQRQILIITHSAKRGLLTKTGREGEKEKRDEIATQNQETRGAEQETGGGKRETGGGEKETGRGENGRRNGVNA